MLSEESKMGEFPSENGRDFQMESGPAKGARDRADESFRELRQRAVLLR